MSVHVGLFFFLEINIHFRKCFSHLYSLKFETDIEPGSSSPIVEQSHRQTCAQPIIEHQHNDSVWAKRQNIDSQ